MRRAGRVPVAYTEQQGYQSTRLGRRDRTSCHRDVTGASPRLRTVARARGRSLIYRRARGPDGARHEGKGKTRPDRSRRVARSVAWASVRHLTEADGRTGAVFLVVHGEVLPGGAR